MGPYLAVDVGVGCVHVSLLFFSNLSERLLLARYPFGGWTSLSF